MLDNYATASPARSRAHEVLFLRSRFAHLERISVLERRNTPIERFVDRALAFAAARDGRPGARKDDLVREARSLIAAYARADGTVQEVVEGHALIAFRPSDIDIDIDIDG